MFKSQSKIIIRNLPKCLTKDQFLKEVENFNGFNYFRFCGSEKYNKNPLNRAYINFTNEDDMYKFKNYIENKPFFDENGTEMFCIVEFAVYQKIPGISKIDCKQGTINIDSEFIKFVEDMKESHKNVNIGSVESNLEEIKNKESDKSIIKTPLIEYLSNIPKKEKSRKEDYRRKVEYGKTFSKKDLENSESKINKVENVISKKITNKEIINDLPSKNESKIKPVEKSDVKKTKPAQRNDIKAYAAAYEDLEYERGFENKTYRGGGRYEGDDKGYYVYKRNYEIIDDKGAYYYNRNSESSYSGRNYGYGYSDYPSHHGSYNRAPPPSSSAVGSAKKMRGGGRRPPAYSATRKD